ncbi:lipoprotein [Streptomyces sp. SID9727]|uniref:lipoprotein n=1 Tax=Streptomyces sp. SID9727 TaxID=2706114 RepID=UPI0031BBB77E
MTRRTVRGLLSALLAAAALTGCSSDADSADAAKPGKSAGAPAAKTAARSGTVGGAGSGCELPVTFDLAEDWKPEAVLPVDPDSELGGFLTQGPVDLVCEIDAKPAGHIGYLRVWQGKGGDASPRAVLEGFVKAEENTSEVTYTRLRTGKQAVTEVTYTFRSPLMDGPRLTHAFALATPDGPVVVHLGGLDTDEHEDMLPAYELARKSVRVG